MDLWHQWANWIFSGGLAVLLVAVFKAYGELRTLKVDAAKAKAEVEAQKAREAQFEASISESSTKVAGEGILKGLLATLVAREQNALEQLAQAREINGGFREEIAELKEQEGRCQEDLRVLRENQMNQHELHSLEIKALHERIYSMGQRMLKAGGAFTATDVVPSHDPHR